MQYAKEDAALLVVTMFYIPTYSDCNRRGRSLQEFE